MIRLAVLLLFLVAATAVVLASRRARAARLARLAQLVFCEAQSSPLPQDGSPLREQFLPQTLVRNLRLLGIDPTLKDGAAMAGAFVLAVVVAALFLGTVPAVFLAVAILFAAVMALNILASRRMHEIGALMPGFFDRVRQLLVIGNSLPTAFARALNGAQPKLAGFFAPALRRVGNGAGFSESIRQSAADIGLYEVDLFSAAVSTNMRFGGSLTHSLSNLVLFLRKRASIERELRANTAQIRFSAWVLGLLPALVAALIVTQNQDYARWFITDPTGKWLLGYCIVSQIMGAFVMRAVIRTEF